MLRLTVTCLLVVAVLGAVAWFAADRLTRDAGAAPTEFASARGGQEALAFDGVRAMGYLEAVCKIGPRISGSEGMKQQQELLKKHFEELGGKVTFQRFKATQHSQRHPVEMVNVIVSWFPERTRRVLLCSHYDTRPRAHEEPNPRDWDKPFLSANDGGSGVAFLMELGHHMKDLNTQVGVDFVFFDGEEYIFEKEEDKYFFGSEHFAQLYAKERPKKNVYIAGVLLDMIAGKNAAFPYEGHSLYEAGALLADIWTIAKEQKCGAFKFEQGQAVLDDHMALNRMAKIPTVDIIDFGYKHWHRLSDVPANCSSDGMEQVSRVLSVWLQRVK
jgi:hypothetical protein